ncbi:hypothetical protein ACI3KY_20250, partial [Microbacterium sp. ZW T2_14]
PATVPAAEQPGPWQVTAAGDVSVSLDGADLVVVADGVTTRRAAASVTALTISAGGHVSLPASLGLAVTVTSAAALAVSGTGVTWNSDGAGSGSVGATVFSGVGRLVAVGSGHVLRGPAADTTWQIDGQRAGSVAGQRFSGFDVLQGAAGNRDDFVVAPGGRIGRVDGGAGGYDVLRFSGAHGAVTSRPTGSQSGTLMVGGTTLAYDGLEPIGPADVTDFDFADATDDDTIEVTPDAVNIGYILVRSLANAFESHSVRPLGSFVVKSTGKGATIRIVGTLTFHGVTFRFEATRVVVGPGGVLDAGAADVVLAATATTADDTPAIAEVILTDAVVRGGNVQATATAVNTADPGATVGLALGESVASALVQLAGTSRIEAQGTVSLASSSTATLVTTSTGTGADAAVDAAVAHATIDNSAVTRITDTASVQAAGAVSISATTVTTATTTADATAATAGAAVATTTA